MRDAFGDRALVVRPGLIVGPHDPTDRFTYWVRRVAMGGEVLTPAPPDYPVQWIDARDLAAFLLSLCERAIGGTYSVVSLPVAIEELMNTSRDATGSDATFTWIPKSFLDEHEVEPWSDLPLWIPDLPGLNRLKAARAVAAGLQTRSVASTVADTLAWDRERPQRWPMKAGLAPEREGGILAAWHAVA